MEKVYNVRWSWMAVDGMELRARSYVRGATSSHTKSRCVPYVPLALLAELFVVTVAAAVFDDFQ